MNYITDRNIRNKIIDIKFFRFFLVLFFSISLAISAKIKFYLPFSIVPFTFQMLVIFLLVFFENRKLAFYSITTYLFLGTLNLPFFANYSGINAFLGPTGGYLIGFLFTSFLSENHKPLLKTSNKNIDYLKLFLKGFSAIFIVYFFGFVGLLRFMNLKLALISGILPFIPFDLCKLIIAIMIYSKFKTKHEIFNGIDI